MMMSPWNQYSPTNPPLSPCLSAKKATYIHWLLKGTFFTRVPTARTSGFGESMPASVVSVVRCVPSGLLFGIPQSQLSAAISIAVEPTKKHLSLFASYHPLQDLSSQCLQEANEDAEKLKRGIAEFYDESSGVWEDIWGDHLHHGFYDPNSTVSLSDHRYAQIRMIEEALQFSSVSEDPLRKPKSIVDVGCGIGGSSRYLARKYGAQCFRITLSSVQAQRARSITAAQGLEDKACTNNPYFQLKVDRIPKDVFP